MRQLSYIPKCQRFPPKWPLPLEEEPLLRCDELLAPLLRVGALLPRELLLPNERFALLLLRTGLALPVGVLTLELLPMERFVLGVPPTVRFVPELLPKERLALP